MPTWVGWHSPVTDTPTVRDDFHFLHHTIFREAVPEVGVIHLKFRRAKIQFWGGLDMRFKLSMTAYKKYIGYCSKLKYNTVAKSWKTPTRHWPCQLLQQRGRWAWFYPWVKCTRLTASMVKSHDSVSENPWKYKEQKSFYDQWPCIRFTRLHHVHCLH